MRRVGFPLIGGRGWLGGYNYLLNLVSVVSAYAAEQIAPVVFFGPEATPAETAPFAAVKGAEVVVDPAFASAGKGGRLAQALVAGEDRSAAGAFRRSGVDVVFEAAAFYGWRLDRPAIAWIPDFQHRHLPELFTRFARLRRDVGFEAQARSGRRIMLSSEDARRDCERFFPSTRGRTAVVRFAIPRAAPVDPILAQETARRHGLDRPFFFLPNQFWRHKNHLVVLEALGLLRAKGVEITVGASGHDGDPRAPGHYQAVLERSRALGVSDLFRPLGLLPYADIAPLMRASAGLINPSRFEGWSTTVEEAKSTGTPMILSDLAVHREQAPQEAQFFDPGSAAQLADRLAAFETQSEEARTRAAEAACVRSIERAAQFAQAFAAVVRDA